MKERQTKKRKIHCQPSTSIATRITVEIENENDWFCFLCSNTKLENMIQCLKSRNGSMKFAQDGKELTLIIIRDKARRVETWDSHKEQFHCNG